MHKFLIFVLSFLLLHTSSLLYSQETLKYTHPDKLYRKGLELFEKGNYVSAQQHFKLAASMFDPKEVHQRGESEFYNALCAIELFNEDAEYLIRSFINSYPDNQKVNQAFFELGKLRYREKKYKDAIYWLNQADKGAFSKEQRAELLFKLGYSYFMVDDIEHAGRAFFEIKDTKNKYSSPATYYYSHISYTQENYATALKGFEKLSNDETFAPLVPYYISQIFFLQKQYEKVVEYAPPILENATPKRAPEIARIIGESYYRLKEYEKAIPFIEKFLETAQSLTREDNYLVGFVYYRNSNYDEAVKYLERVPTDEDVLSQNANYHLADCYIKLNDKAKARQAFAMASKYDFDMSIKEDALFNFAKITYETLYNPFNEAIDAFRKYIELFPESPRIDEAHNYLVLAYSNTKNYQEALDALDKIRVKDASIKSAYQRVAFFRGLEHFQNLNFPKAKELFTLSLSYPEFNQTINAQSLYWRGESYYRLDDYASASTDFNLFLLSPGSFSLPEYQMAHYNLGYSNFKLKNYDEAVVWFRKYTTIAAKKTDQILGDAFNRIGDSYFIQRRYWVALDYYEKAINTNTIDVDYAYFQRGFAFGLVERPQKKIETLLEMVSQFPESNYLDDALFELAETYLALNETNNAEEYYSRIEKDFPGSSYYVKALVQLGIASYNKNDNENAMQYYKRVVEEFPGSPEAKNSLVGLRNIYVDMGEVNKYFDYASTLGSLGNVSMAEKDSLSYIATEKVYMSGDCQKTVQNFNKYLEEFPKGNFVLNANYYIGDCLYKQGNIEEALPYFNYVVQRQKNQFTEQTLLAVSDIYMRTERHAEAFEVFDLLETLADVKTNLLEARIGKLRSASKLNQPQDVVEAAAKVLITEKLPPEIEREARYERAHALVALNRTDDAFDEFAHLSENVKSPQGAEAKYMMAKIYFEKGDLDKSEAEVFNFAQQNTPHQYWLANSFILLADVYAQKDDFFQAKATLQSVLDGYTNTEDGIIDLASDKLSELIKTEREKQKGTEADTIRVKWSF
ncbi:MAG TPA: tetratricopeptide repeat protein [Tenuifilaceae bacterium]|nr:tetratricopeptide repeat protein [Tenuifilaceae bacterium]HPE18944.1 tetratricopeptide repeat protein [Tenuifilaceae bacterium]HPJ46421.1 tetratricopeptide repeat protein [Tenuifilaceae bacterium]HPQ34588.1 tetratricopeptide repeat protein [Tenuifilaceae bacterium]HRX67442.1 tetratricopeptide repeat protein [Tenuifilaceae bacterium]